MIQTAFNVQTEELPFIEARELYENQTPFKVEKIFVKENVQTKFGVQDVAYVTIRIEDERYVFSAKQTVLVKNFKAMKNLMDMGQLPYPEDADYMIGIPEGKSYYVLMVDVDE